MARYVTLLPLKRQHVSSTSRLCKQVKGEAQGSEDALKEFINHLNKGPPAADVTGVEHSEISTKEGETGFGVSR
jgi:hypothetical protein